MITEAMDHLGLKFSFHDAIDGRQRLPPEYEGEIDRNLTPQTCGKTMSDSEYACALSHSEVYSRILNDTLTGAVVLEDDSIIGPSFKRFVLEEHYRSFSMVFLAHGVAWGRRGTRKDLFPGCTVWELVANPYRATGYSIQAGLAQNILEHMKPICRPADAWPCDLSRFGAVVAHPSLVGFDDDLQSTIQMRKSAHRTAKRYFSSQYWKIKINKLLGVRIPASSKNVS